MSLSIELKDPAGFEAAPNVPMAPAVEAKISPVEEKVTAAADSNATTRDFRLGDLCWLHPPKLSWSPFYYLGVQGAENFHIYLWAAKDLCWTQDAYWPGYILGGLAVSWVGYLTILAVLDRNFHEVWCSVGQFMWLFANYWWMSGELHDSYYSSPPSQQWYNQRRIDAGNIMNATLIWLGLYWFVVRYFNLFPPSQKSLDYYERNHSLKPSWPMSLIFKNWRDYENIHTLFWAGKDNAWMHYSTYSGQYAMWVVFMIPTIIISLDFIKTTLFHKEAIIENAHYTAVFLWIMGNFTWAFGEINSTSYLDKAINLALQGDAPAYDDPVMVANNATVSMSLVSYGLRSSRWAAGWMFISAFVPLFFMYSIWFFAQATGKTGRFAHGNVDDDEEEDNHAAIEGGEGGKQTELTASGAHFT